MNSLSTSPAVLLAAYCVLALLAALVSGALPSLMRLTHPRLQPAVSFVAGLMLGLSLHSVFDGLAMAAAVASGEQGHGEALGLGTALAVILHKPFGALAITALMAASGAARSSRHLVNLAFALVTPLGALLFYVRVTELPRNWTAGQRAEGSAPNVGARSAVIRRPGLGADSVHPLSGFPRARGFGIPSQPMSTNRSRGWLPVFVVATLFGGPGVSPAAAPANPRPPTPPVAAGASDWFEDVTRRAGIDFVQQFCHRRIANILLSNGSGGAVFDFDNDGWMDLYLVNWGPLEGVTDPKSDAKREPNRLYRNRGNGTFEDATKHAGLEGSGYSSAATAGDFDNDGFTDLYIAIVGRNTLYRNRGDGTFEDVTAKAGVGHTGTGISAVFFDADNDGWLDLFVANYLTYKAEAESEQNPGAYPGPLAYPGEANVLYRNKGDGTFEDVTKSAGLFAPGHRAMSVSAFDADWDGNVDLYVCNDDTPNQLWQNDGKGHFREVGMEAGVAFNSIGEAPGSMNAAVGDADGDGWPDLFVTRFGYGSLYVRTGASRYEDRIYASGLGRLTQQHVGWGGAFLDFDNDADLDLVVANGSAFVLDGTDTLLLENQGSARFSDASAKGGAFFKTPVNGRGNAILDFDNDGRLDVLLTALADRAFLLRNRCPLQNHWLKLRLEGTRSNRSGYGARVTLTAGDLTRRAEALCPTGFLMQGDPRVHFGLGPRSQVDTIEIRWPSGAVQTLKDIAANRILEVREPKP